MPQDIITDYQPQFNDVLEHLRTELSSIRTGRAHASLVENIMVEAYGSRMTLTGVASITIPDARSILIEPWDSTLVKEVEKAIIDSKIGVMPSVAGKSIRIAMPMLTEESRKNLVKITTERLEQARIGVRKVRDQAKGEIVNLEKAKEIGEDEKYRLLEALDKVAAGFNERIKHLGEEKEKEIMSI